MKSIISICLAFLCLATVFLFPVSAQEKGLPEGIEANTQTDYSGVTVLAGGEGKSGVSSPNVITVNIHIAPSDYKSLISSPHKKQHSSNVSVGESEYEFAQINIRGNSSRQFGLHSSTKRIPFELSFPEVHPFGGLENKSVKFINSFYPYRLIAEYLALDLFSFAGIPTPVHSFAFIRFNDVDFGLYIAVEDVNKAFLSKWYPEPLNSAYKATVNEEKRSEYIESEWFGNLFEKVSGESDHLSALFAALDNGEGYEQYINVDEWLRFFACCAVMGGDGTFLTEQNNYVMYENDGRFDLIPWDLSEAFSGRRAPDGIDHFYVWHNENNPNPLFELLMSNLAYRDTYHNYIRELTEDFLSPSAIQARYDAILDAIAPYLPQDHSVLLNGEDTLPALRSNSPDGFFNLRSMLNKYYQNLNAQLSGREDSFAINDQLADFYENGDSYDYILSEIEPLSPWLDASLPQRIISQGKTIAIEKPNNRYWVIGLLVAAVMIIGAAVLVTVKNNAGVRGAEPPGKILVTEIGSFFRRHKVMFFFFIFIVTYECIFVWQFKEWEIGSYPYVYHALDYSLGFCTRVLPGAVSNFLLGEVTVFKVTIFETVLLLLFFVCLSFFLEKLYFRLKKEDRPYGLVLMFLFVCGPCSFGIYVNELGMLDSWMLYTAAVIFLLLLHKRLWLVIIVFAFILSLIYTASILSFAPFVVIILLYKASVEKKQKDRCVLFVVAGVFAFVAIATTLYFLNFEPKNIKLTPDEFFSMIYSRGCKTDDEVYNIFFGIAPEGYGVSQGEKALFLYQIIARIQIHLAMLFENSNTKFVQVAHAFLLICPVLLLLFSLFFYKMKNSRQPIQKFSCFCMCMLFFFINVVCFFVSTDTHKWLAQAFILTFACFLFVLYHEPQILTEKIKPLMHKIPFPVWVIYGIIYAITVFRPYS